MDPCVYFKNTTTALFSRLDAKVIQVDVPSLEASDCLKDYDLKDFPYLIYIEPSQVFKPYTGSLEPIEIFSTLDRIQRGPARYESIESLEKDLHEKFYTDGLILTQKQSEKSLKSLCSELMPFMPVAQSSFDLSTFGCRGPCVVIFRPEILQVKAGDKTWTALNGSPTAGQVAEAFYSGLVWMTPNSHVWLGKEKPLMTLYAKITGKGEPSTARYVISRYLSVAKDYFDIFTVAVGKIDDFQWILHDIGLGKHKSLLMFDDTEDMYYEFDLVSANFSVNTEKIKKFIEKFIAGEVKPFIISENLPQEPVQNGIKVLVGNTVKKELEEVKKDTILLVYAFYNQELESLIYFFEQIANRMKELQIFKIESHRNYVPASFMDHGTPAAFYIKPGYEPQLIKIDLENPEVTLKIIYKYFRSSRDL
jgi:hypothetical protein